MIRSELFFIHRIKAIKNLFLFKLDTLLSQIAEIGQLVKDLAQASRDGAKNGLSLLQSTIHLIEAQQQVNSELQRVKTELQSLKDLQSLNQYNYKELNILQQQIEQLGAVHQNQFGVVQQHIEILKLQQEQATQQIEQKIGQQITALSKQNKAIVKTDNYQLLNPELGLMAYLYSFLPNRIAVDIGANSGEVSEYLLNAGYEVYAFEPFSPVFEKLCDRLKQNTNFHPYKLAIGSKDSMMDLHIASDLSGVSKYKDATLLNSLVDHAMPLEDLQFTKTVPVPVRSLESLHSSMEIPSNASLIKIDTEGFDLEVIWGMGDYRYPVVMTEFWDRKMLFGRTVAYNYIDEQVRVMRQRGYHWHIVVYRITNSDETAFYCNCAQSVPDSWGNVVFFQNYNLFSQALKWCSAVMPMTYFNSGSDAN
jgi:FkbM family methyltransferase